MKKRSITILFFTILIVAVCGGGFYLWNNSKKFNLPEEDKKSAFDMAKNFAECAGYFDSLSWLAEKAGRSEASISFKNTYRGWYMSGAYMLYGIKAIQDWHKAIDYMESTSQAASQSFKAKIENNNQGFEKELNVFFKETCEPLVEYQTSLVDEMRKDMATQSGSSK